MGKYKMSNEKTVDDFLLETENSRFYVVLGKTTKWNETDTPPDTAPSSKDGVSAIRLLKFSKMIGRIDWVHDEQYNPQTVVVTNSCNVFQCITKGNKSTIQPENLTRKEFQTSDGYVWKFLYQIPPEVFHEFATPDLIPLVGKISEPLDSYTVMASIDIGGRDMSNEFPITFRQFVVLKNPTRDGIALTNDRENGFNLEGEPLQYLYTPNPILINGESDFIHLRFLFSF